MTRYWAVVPAAGVGRRMGGSIPKQYLPLMGRTVIETTLGVLTSHPRIDKVFVALGAEDGYWADTSFARHPKVSAVTGGAERVNSVANALAALAAEANSQDWVLVHDAARPCLRTEDVDRMMEQLLHHAVGGVLGMPVRDTMKRTDDAGVISQTVERRGLWHAFTPQMFRVGVLADALEKALLAGVAVTDEASAIEYIGLAPRMVEGHADNLKITHPLDLPLAEFYLRRR